MAGSRTVGGTDSSAPSGRKLIPLPSGERLLPRWVYTIKRSGRYKARFVIRGDKQRPGIDYEETFASVVRPETLRALFAMIATKDLEAQSYDVICAFLYALMTSGIFIYVRPPQGYETYDSFGNLLVWLLLRALYGLKQSPRLWYQELIQFLLGHGFRTLPSDPCVLQNDQGDILILWVDDIISVSETPTGI